MHLVSTIDLVYKYFIYEFLCSCHKKESNWQNNANVDKDSKTYQHMKIVLRLWDSLDGPTSVIFRSPQSELLPH